MKRWTTVVLAGLIVAGPLAGAAWAADEVIPLDKAMKEMAVYKFGQSRAALIAVGKHVMASQKDAAAQKKLAARLAGVLKSDATLDSKRFVCRQLSIIGAAPEVPALGALLGDKDLSHMARYALERIPDAEAATALRGALGSTKGKLLVGVINSVANGRDAKALGALIKMMGDADADVAAAAVAAVGKIGGEQAAAALAGVRGKGPAKVQAEATDAFLRCADGLLAAGKTDAAAGIYEKLYAPAEPTVVRIAALRGLAAARQAKACPLIVAALKGKDPALRAAASRHVRTIQGKGLTATFAKLVSSLPAEGQVLLLEALAARGDSAAAPAVIQAASSSDESVKAAAVGALGALGGADSVPLLAREAAGKGAPAEAAAGGLARLPGKGVDAALLSQLGKGDAGVKVAVIQALVARRTPGAVAPLVTAAGGADKTVAREAFKALGDLAGEADLPALVQLVLKSSDSEAAGATLSTVGRRQEDKDKAAAPVVAAIASADGPAKSALLKVLGGIGGKKAMETLRVAYKGGNADVKDAAVRGLCNWPDATAAEPLLELAGEADDLKHQVLAFRGYIRVVGLPSERKAGETLAMYQDAMKAAPRPEEKKQALAGIGKLKDPAAITALAGYLGDKDLRNEAAAAIFRLAADKKLIRSGAVKKALRPALSTIAKSDDKKNAKKAEALLKQIK